MPDSLLTNSERTARIVELLIKWYHTQRDGIFSKACALESKPPYGIKRGSPEHITWLTLTISINYSRPGSSLWYASRVTWADETTRWVFDPKEVSIRSLKELVLTLRKYKLSKKYSKNAEIWRTTAISFLKLFQGNPVNLLKCYDYDAFEIYLAMHSKHSKNFPSLSRVSRTSKILLQWIRMLKDEAHVDLKNINKIPIPIDLHNARATITTGCLVGSYNGPFEDLAVQAQKAWTNSCEKSFPNYYPLQLDEMLSNLSRFGCSKRKNEDSCPVKDKCRLSKFCTANSTLSVITFRNKNVEIRTEYPH